MLKPGIFGSLQPFGLYNDNLIFNGSFDAGSITNGAAHQYVFSTAWPENPGWTCPTLNCGLTTANDTWVLNTIDVGKYAIFLKSENNVDRCVEQTFRIPDAGRYRFSFDYYCGDVVELTEPGDWTLQFRQYATSVVRSSNINGGILSYTATSGSGAAADLFWHPAGDATLIDSTLNFGSETGAGGLLLGWGDVSSGKVSIGSGTTLTTIKFSIGDTGTSTSNNVRSVLSIDGGTANLTGGLFYIAHNGPHADFIVNSGSLNVDKASISLRNGTDALCGYNTSRRGSRARLRFSADSTSARARA